MTPAKKLKNAAVGSWKTTIVSILAALAILAPQALALLDDDPNTKPDWALVFAALGLGGAGTLARDNDKRSEQVQ